MSYSLSMGWCRARAARIIQIIVNLRVILFVRFCIFFYLSLAPGKIICAMERVSGTCMVAGSAMQYWSTMARPAPSKPPTLTLQLGGLCASVDFILVYWRLLQGGCLGARVLVDFRSEAKWCLEQCAGWRLVRVWCRLPPPARILWRSSESEDSAGAATVRWRLLSHSVRAGQLTIQLNPLSCHPEPFFPLNLAGVNQFIPPCLVP